MARNQSGPNGSVAAGGRTPRKSCVPPPIVGPAGAPVFDRCSAACATDHTPRKTSDGRSSRRSRLFTNAHVVSPRRRNESYATKFEKPPTKKKIGITWKNQVASHIHDVTPTALVVWMIPCRHQM